MAKFDENKKIVLEKLDTDTAEFFYDNFVRMIDKANDDFALSYDINAYNKLAAKLVAVLDSALLIQGQGPSKPSFTNIEGLECQKKEG